MANKQSFTPEEWTKILESTMLTGMAVSAAEPSRLWGALKEAFASSSALAAAKMDAGSSELIKAVIADFETSEGRTATQEAIGKRLAGAKPADAVQRSLANLRRCRPSSMLRRPAMRLPSKAGCAASARKWQKPRRRVVSSVLEACK